MENWQKTQYPRKMKIQQIPKTQLNFVVEVFQGRIIKHFVAQHHKLDQTFRGVVGISGSSIMTLMLV